VACRGKTDGAEEGVFQNDIHRGVRYWLQNVNIDGRVKHIKNAKGARISTSYAEKRGVQRPSPNLVHLAPENRARPQICRGLGNTLAFSTWGSGGERYFGDQNYLPPTRSTSLRKKRSSQ